MLSKLLWMRKIPHPVGAEGVHSHCDLYIMRYFKLFKKNPKQGFDQPCMAKMMP